MSEPGLPVDPKQQGGQLEAVGGQDAHEQGGMAGIGTGGVLASISLLAGFLTWVRLVPFGTLLLAGTAVVTSLFAFREFKRHSYSKRDRIFAAAGLVLGLAGLIVFMAYLVTTPLFPADGGGEAGCESGEG